jgi:hypothetical protein
MPERISVFRQTVSYSDENHRFTIVKYSPLIPRSSKQFARLSGYPDVFYLCGSGYALYSRSRHFIL